MNISKNFYLAKNIIASNFSNKIAPYKLTFAVTYNCNSRCTTCNIWKKNSKNELSCDEIDRFFSTNSDFSWIDITGGEIFLRNDLIQIFQIIKKRCKKLYTLHFPTNGLMTHRIVNLVKKIVKLDFNKLIISISIDGPPDIHDKIRGVKGGFMKTIETFRKLREIKGLDVYAGMTLSKNNVDHLDDTVNAIKKEIPNFTFDDLHINIAHSSPHYYGIEFNELPVKKVISQISSVIRRKKISLINPVTILELKYLKNIEKYLKWGKCPMQCHSLSKSIFIDPYGGVYPCTAYDKKLGNVKSIDLKKIFLDPESKKLAKEIRELKCPQCWTPCEAYQTILANLFRFNN
jgi:MoaA/NifB/PqqE/SkfB family radical SAM enzyme